MQMMIQEVWGSPRACIPSAFHFSEPFVGSTRHLLSCFPPLSQAVLVQGGCGVPAVLGSVPAMLGSVFLDP